MQLLRAVVEPAVRPAGFELTGNGGFRPSDGSLIVLFEANPDVFPARFQRFLAGYDEDGPGCVDLWVEYDPRARTVRGDLEGTDVGHWLREHGREAMAQRLDSPSDLEKALESLADGLRAMLAEERSGP
ncbi:MAG: hypothetical protein ACRDI0_04215 [Actinomycetota bacterium]